MLGLVAIQATSLDLFGVLLIFPQIAGSKPPRTERGVFFLVQVAAEDLEHLILRHGLHLGDGHLPLARLLLRSSGEKMDMSLLDVGRGAKILPNYSR